MEVVSQFINENLPMLLGSYFAIGFIFTLFGVMVVMSRGFDADRYIPICATAIILWPVILLFPIFKFIWNRLLDLCEFVEDEQRRGSVSGRFKVNKNKD